jgi:hypothetical protein
LAHLGASAAIGNARRLIFLKYGAARRAFNRGEATTADMTAFFLLFEKWANADHAAARAELRLSHSLDMYCEGLGAAPSLALIAETRELRAAANHRLRLLWEKAREARSCLPVI